jgi:hypothetical protein
VGLGHFDDDTSRLHQAIAYLQKPRSQMDPNEVTLDIQDIYLGVESEPEQDN